MNSKEKKFGKERLLKIGSRYVGGNESVRELAEEFGVSRTVVSHAKDVYLAFRAGKKEKEREMKDRVREPEVEIEEPSATKSDESKNNRSTSSVDLQDYAKDPGKQRSEPEGEEGGWGWIWLLAGEAVALYWMWTTFFKNTSDRS